MVLSNWDISHAALNLIESAIGTISIDSALPVLLIRVGKLLDTALAENPPEVALAKQAGVQAAAILDAITRGSIALNIPL